MLISNLGLWDLNVDDLHKDLHKHINSATKISKWEIFKTVIYLGLKCNFL